ncbi:MAG TPA: hypothetical protein VK171_10465, partial [Fimbriimonas sp.]|nr:hypothetical protein [Fimbriimonas sp.]
MKNAIKLFVATAIVGALSVSAFAQGAGPAGQKGGAKGGPAQGGPGGGGMRRMGDMDGEILAKLNLTDAQKSAIKKLKESMKTKMEALMKSAAPKGDGKADKNKGGPAAGGPGARRMQMSPELRQKFTAIRDDYQAGLKKTLTPKQFGEYEKAVKEMREKMRQQFGNRGPGAGGPAGAGKG